MHDQNQGETGYLRDRGKVAKRTEGHVFLKAWQAHDVVVRGKQGVAIRRRLRNALDSDLARGAWLGFDQELLTEDGCELLCHEPRRDLDRIARAERYDDPDRFGRVRLCIGNTGQEKE